MSKIASSALSLVGGTPLVETQRVAADLQLKARVLVKLESFNPAGSVKDRAALAMVEAAEREGKLAPGATLVVDWSLLLAQKWCSLRVLVE